jgi:hypothetical protein
MPPEGLQVDHIDGDGLNNRRSNLRVATKQQNNWNVKRDGRLKGVYPSGTRWAARINLNGKEIHLGVHATIEEAAHVYDAAAIHYFGEYACLNFPGSDPLPFIPRIKKPKSSRFSGVAKAGTRWMAYAKSGGKQIYLGVYETEEEAAVARQQFDRSPEEGKRGCHTT